MRRSVCVETKDSNFCHELFFRKEKRAAAIFEIVPFTGKGGGR